MNAAYCIVKMLQQLCEEVEIRLRLPTPLTGDCMPAQNAATCPGANRSKMVHVEASAFNLRDGLDNGEIVLQWVPSEECAADVLTKALGPTLFAKFKRVVMGLLETAEVKAALASVVRRREAVLRAAAAGGDEVLKSLALKIIEEYS